MKKRNLLVLAFTFGAGLSLAACNEVNENLVSIDAPELSGLQQVYTGSEITIDVKSDAAYSISGNKATNVGTYQIHLSLNDGYKWTDNSKKDKVIEWTIAKGYVEKPTLSSNSLVYNGEKQQASISANSLYSVSGNEAICAGSYNACVNLVDNFNYAWKDGSKDPVVIPWTIAKAKVAKPELDNAELTFNGSNQQVALKDASDLYYLLDNQVKSAGNYNAKVVLKDKVNYEWEDGSNTDLSLAFKVNKKDVEVPVASETTFTYNGEEQGLSLQENPLYSVANCKAINAGSYNASVTLLDSENYKWASTFTGKINYVIEKANYDTSNLQFEDLDIAYDGEEHEIKVVGLPEDVQVTYTTNKATNVGDELTAVAKFTINGNYNETVLSAKLKISKAENEIEANDIELTYTGEALDATATSLFGTASFVYCSDKDNATETALTEIVNAGVYYYKAVVEGTDNYLEADSGWKKFTVNKADYDLSAMEFITSVVFDTNKHKVEVKGLPSGVSYESIGTAKDEVGKYEFTITLSATNLENYNDLATKEYSKTLEITKRVYEISTAEQLYKYLHNYDSKDSYEVGSGESAPENALYLIKDAAGNVTGYKGEGINKEYIQRNSKFLLLNDIDLSTYNDGKWVTVGSACNNSFTSGEFDGNGFTIKNFTILKGEHNDTGFVEYGFFGGARKGASIHDVKFENVTVDASNVGTDDYTNGLYVGTVLAFCCGDAGANSGPYNVSVYNVEVINSFINVNREYGKTGYVGFVFGLDRFNYTGTNGNVRDNLVVKNSDIVFKTAQAKKYGVGGISGQLNYNDSSLTALYSNCVLSNNKIVVVADYTTSGDFHGVAAYSGHVNGSINVYNCSNDTAITIYKSDSTAVFETGSFGSYDKSVSPITANDNENVKVIVSEASFTTDIKLLSDITENIVVREVTVYVKA